MNRAFERYAYHEAGHAAALLYFNRNFSRVDIVPSDGYNGRVHNVYLKDSYDDLLILGAGMYAERIKFERHPYANELSETDVNEMHRIITATYGAQNLTMVNRQVMEECDYILRSQWSTVEKIAMALMEKKSLRYDEVKQIIQ